jgi:hypothetical protein
MVGVLIVTAVLRLLYQLSGNREYVFPAQGKAKHMSTGTILLALDRMGYRAKMTGHGFRGIASTLLHEAGFDEKYIAQLAHQKRNNKTAAADNVRPRLHHLCALWQVGPHGSWDNLANRPKAQAAD